jgi:DNA-binding PadR family transcriptional regulator
MRTLEERVLRVLYEGSASAAECAAELQASDSETGGFVALVDALLTVLAQDGYLESFDTCERRYSLTPAGSERLADLVEAAERSRGAA